MSNAANALGR